MDGQENNRGWIRDTDPERRIMTDGGIPTEDIRLQQIGHICYSGGPLDPYDKMAEIAIKSLDDADGLCFIVCAVDKASVPLCFKQIGDGDEQHCMFRPED